MTKETFYAALRELGRALINAVVIALVALVAFFSAILPAMNTQSQGQGQLGVLSAPLWTANRTGTTLTAASGATLGLNLGSSITGMPAFTAGTTISPTNGGVITPTATLQPISSAGTVTPTLSITDATGTAYANNTLLILYNTSATSIVFADSGTLNTTGTITLGQYDTLMLRFDTASGTWVELSTSNN
jgi:hypothetical protein